MTFSADNFTRLEAGPVIKYVQDSDLTLLSIYHAPPRCSGTIRGSRRAFTDFSDFLGRLLVIVEFYSPDYLGLMALGLRSDKAERDSEKHGVAPNSEQQKFQGNILTCCTWRKPMKPTLHMRRNLERLSTRTLYSKLRLLENITRIVPEYY